MEHITPEQITDACKIRVESYRFIAWYNNIFKFDPLFTDMSSVTEGSPYHRETSVAIHTDMVVQQYLSSDGFASSKNMLLGAFAAVFHDVGKPHACEEKYSESRGQYYSFNGHEPISARLWEDYAIRNWSTLVELFDFNLFDGYAIGWMIEYHLPWGIKNPDKLDSIARTTKHYGFTKPYGEFLMADNLGRISDPSTARHKDGLSWVFELHYRCSTLDTSETAAWSTSDKILFVPIGASGTGKTTSFTEIQERYVDNNPRVFSLDILRHYWYDAADYSNAWRLSCDDKNFKQRWQAHFHQMLTDGGVLYIDNLNLSKKSRRFFIAAARQQGFKVVAIISPVDIGTVIERQNTRTDKYLSPPIVREQYMRMQYPSLGEFDDIIIRDNNLSKTE